MVGIGCHSVASADSSLDTIRLHQPADTSLAYGHSISPQLLMDPWAPVGPSTFGTDPSDVIRQVRIP